MDEAADRFFSPRKSPFSFFSLWNPRSVVPGKGTGETADKEEDIVDDNEYSNEGDPHYRRAW